MKRSTLLAYGCTALLLSACGPKPSDPGAPCPPSFRTLPHLYSGKTLVSR